MKVLYLTTHLNAGGITSYVFTLTKGLINLGHEVFIVSSGGGLEKEFKKLGAEVIKLDIKTKSDVSPKLFFNFPRLQKIIKEKDIDIIHAQTRVTQVLATWLQKKTSAKCVSTCHGFFKPKWTRIKFPCWGDFVIAISDAVNLHLIKDLKVSDKKIKIIQSGINLRKFVSIDSHGQDKGRQQYNLHGDPIIGMIGRLSDVKGQDVLVMAMPEVLKRFPEAKLFLVGEGKLKGLLIDLIDKLKLKENIIFLSVVDKAHELMPLFDVIAHPSRQEGLGLSLMEAQACGRVVVASNVGGIPSLIEDGETGILVEKENPEALAKGLIRVLSDKELALKIEKHASKRAQRGYSDQLMVGKIIKLYENLLENYEKNSCC
jgi:glycosyltransferase involved in cell wall biosynthesis